ncbi:hypothetical protein CR513_28159, partial [Mucuna pruriens]
MEVVVDDLEERHEALRNDANQLKEQMGFTSNQPQNRTQCPLCGLLPGHTPPVNNNSDPHVTSSNLQNQIQHQDSHFKNNDARAFISPPPMKLQLINPTPIVVLHPHKYEDPHFTKMLQLFKERLKAIERADYSDFNVANMFLIPQCYNSPQIQTVII